MCELYGNLIFYSNPAKLRHEFEATLKDAMNSVSKLSQPESRKPEVASTSRRVLETIPPEPLTAQNTETNQQMPLFIGDKQKSNTKQVKSTHELQPSQPRRDIIWPFRRGLASFIKAKPSTVSLPSTSKSSISSKPPKVATVVNDSRNTNSILVDEAIKAVPLDLHQLRTNNLCEVAIAPSQKDSNSSVDENTDTESSAGHPKSQSWGIHSASDLSNKKSFIDQSRLEHLCRTQTGLANFNYCDSKGTFLSSIECPEIVKEFGIGEYTISMKHPGRCHAADTWLDVDYYNDDEEWSTLVFQGKDGCIHLVKNTPDGIYSTGPIVQGIENTPLRCGSTKKYHESLESHTVYIFFVQESPLGIPLLSECKVIFNNYKPKSWTVSRIALENHDYPPVPMKNTNFFTHYDKDEFETFNYVAESGELISLTNSGDWPWKKLRLPGRFALGATSRVFSSKSIAGDKDYLHVRIYDSDVSRTVRIQGIDSWADYDGKISKNNCQVWRKQIIVDDKDPGLVPEFMVYDEEWAVVGFFARTADNKIFAYQGHPWRDQDFERRYICTVKAGSHYHFSGRSCFFISPDDEMRVMRFGNMESGHIDDWDVVSDDALPENSISNGPHDFLLAFPLEPLEEPQLSCASSRLYSMSSHSSSETASTASNRTRRTRDSVASRDS